MKTIRVCYTVLDLIEVPEDATPEEIDKFCRNNWDEFCDILIVNDIEWEDR